jgi:ERCC4-type nuclease
MQAEQHLSKSNLAFLPIALKKGNNIKIIADTREQKVLEFSHPYISQVKREKLDVGDYQVEYTDGYRPPVIFERKSLEDCIGSLSKGYKRFRKEILRAKESNVLLVILIEASITKVLKGIEHSQRSGDEILQQLFTITVRHRVPFFCFNNREEMSRFITEAYLAIGRDRMIKK